MLSSSEQESLSRIDLLTRQRDRRFADGLRDGRPRLPREIRMRRTTVVVLVLGIAVLTTAVVLLIRR